MMSCHDDGYVCQMKNELPPTMRAIQKIGRMAAFVDDDGLTEADALLVIIAMASGDTESRKYANAMLDAVRVLGKEQSEETNGCGKW